MNTPFKLKSGNKPDKPGFFGTFAPAVNRIIQKSKKATKVRSIEDFSEFIGFPSTTKKSNEKRS